MELHNIKTALVDMDILVYRSGFAVERTEVDDHGAKIKVVEPLENAIYLVNKTLEKISDRTKCTGMVGFLSGSTNFRDKIAVTRKYKDRPSRKPVHYDALREHFLQFDGIYEVEGQEADDALGIHQKEDTCICTIDKDLDQVPGWHYNFVKDEGYFINEHEGQYHFHKQWLVGDSVDSIPGCPGIGLVRAKKILDKCASPLDYAECCIRTYHRQCPEEVDIGTIRRVYIRAS